MATHTFQATITFDVTEYDTAPEDAVVLLVKGRMPDQFDVENIDVLKVFKYGTNDVDAVVEITVDGPLDTTNLVEELGEE